MSNLLNEAKDLSVYKKLINVLGDYTDRYPGTGVERLFRNAIDLGMKVMPSDKNAIAVLDSVLSNGSGPQRVQNLLNMRFADLPLVIKPTYKLGNRKEVAFWLSNEQIYDRVISLLNQSKSGGKGKWCDIDGKGVDIIDTNTNNGGK